MSLSLVCVGGGGDDFKIMLSDFQPQDIFFFLYGGIKYFVDLQAEGESHTWKQLS